MIQPIAQMAAARPKIVVNMVVTSFRGTLGQPLCLHRPRREKLVFVHIGEEHGVNGICFGKRKIGFAVKLGVQRSDGDVKASRYRHPRNFPSRHRRNQLAVHNMHRIHLLPPSAVVDATILPPLTVDVKQYSTIGGDFFLDFLHPA